MGEISLINCKNAFSANGLEQAIKCALVQVAGLVVHSRHNSVCKKSQFDHAAANTIWDKHTRRVHDTANHEAGSRAAGQVQSGPVFHTKVLRQATLGEEVSRQLNRTTETGAHHRCAYTAIQSLHSLGFIDLAQAVERVAIVVLCTDRKERREGL